MAIPPWERFPTLDHKSRSGSPRGDALFWKVKSPTSGWLVAPSTSAGVLPPHLHQDWTMLPQVPHIPEQPHLSIQGTTLTLPAWTRSSPPEYRPERWARCFSGALSGVPSQEPGNSSSFMNEEAYTTVNVPLLTCDECANNGLTEPVDSSGRNCKCPPKANGEVQPDDLTTDPHDVANDFRWRDDWATTLVKEGQLSKAYSALLKQRLPRICETVTRKLLPFANYLPRLSSLACRGPRSPALLGSRLGSRTVGLGPQHPKEGLLPGNRDEVMRQNGGGRQHPRVPVVSWIVSASSQPWKRRMEATGRWPWETLFVHAIIRWLQNTTTTKNGAC